MSIQSVKEPSAKRSIAVLKAFNTVASGEPLSHGREERMDVAASATSWGGQDNDFKEYGRTVQGLSLRIPKVLAKDCDDSSKRSRWPPARKITLVAGT